MNIFYIIIIYYLFAINSPAAADSGDGIISDNSMNTNVSKVNNNEYDINGGITGTGNKNLFHSFKNFNIEKDEKAVFFHNDNIENIISRVTGQKSTWIDGLLTTKIENSTEAGNVNFYLLNTNGIFFGQHAKIDIKGSFYGSTADYLEFGNENNHFDVNSPNPILYTEPITAFGFLDDDIGEIQSNDNGGLIGDNGVSFTLIGGNITINNSRIEVPNRINFVSASSIGKAIFMDNNIKVDTFDTLGNIVFSNTKIISYSTCQVYIRGGVFSMSNCFIDNFTNIQDDSIVDISADNIYFNKSDIFSESDVAIYAANKLFFSDGNQIFTRSNNLNSGNVLINASLIEFLENSKIVTKAEKGCKSGDVSLNAKEYVLFSNDSNISASGFNSLAGDISIISNNIIFAYGSGIENTIRITNICPEDFLNNLSGSIGGNIYLQADLIEFYGTSSYSASTLHTNVYGNFNNKVHAGNIEINARKISFLNGGALYADSGNGNGNGGKIKIYATEAISLNGYNSNNRPDEDEYASAITVRSEDETSDNAGNAGEIYIETPKITLSDYAEISASSKGSGNAGKITLIVGNLELSSGAKISSSSNSIANGGNAGSINIISNDLIQLKNNSIISTLTNGAGNAGFIDIISNKIIIEKNSLVSSASTRDNKESGSAGSINIKSYDKIHILDGSILSSNTKYAGDVDNPYENGDINISAVNMIYLSHSDIVSNIISTSGLGGDIEIDPIFLIFNKGKIIGNAFIKQNNNISTGDGGNVNINADFFIYSNTLFYSANYANIPSSFNNELSIKTETLNKNFEVTRQADYNGLKNEDDNSILEYSDIIKEKKKIL